MATRPRRTALVTGVGRTVGIGAGVAMRLARDGWDVATSYWAPYDDRMPWGRQPDDPAELERALREAGARTVAIPGDLERTDTPGELFDGVEAALGPVTALVLAHCESVDGDLRETTVESFDRHYAVNVRAAWL
ncbi:MAG: SDR family NAD(P)-dependent oxidoreductase, partial [Candidatus Dormibacteraceae bacterium]